MSRDGKATVQSGAVSRGGLTRGDHRACEQDLGLQEKYIPGGMVDDESGQLSSTCGSAYKTSDGIVAALAAWWAALDEPAQVAMARLQSNMEHGPERRGRRTQFLQRLVAFGEAIGQPMQRRYSPPSHRKYHPIERCWGIVALPWNGTKWVEVETMVPWAKSMTWKGMPPIGARSRQGYQKGVTLRKSAMRAVEARLERHLELPKWDMLLHPASTS